ncbi:NrdH-redoxin [Streptomyces sp. SID4985]|uniref:glutaredoxin domain-containing protein n=1 Tax=Streptomyces sp. SID4985 TaxID=2690292 RepID=UPI00136B7D04|nr:NrdH-redoxin [Streptomyces sp. SID4985]
MTEDRDGIVVHWRPMCPYCMKLRLRLRLSKLPYTEVNIWRDPDAAAYVRSVADGNETVPTVSVAGHGLVNPSLGEIERAVAEYAPHLLPGGR